MTALKDQVLLLNQGYRAVSIVEAREAFCLMIRGVAEAVDIERVQASDKYYTYSFASWVELSEFRSEFEIDAHRWVHGVSLDLVVPHIIRLISYNDFRRQEPRLTRRNVFNRDNNICQYCGKTFKSPELSLDHIFPKSRGGKLEWANIVCACVKCNVRKGSKTPKEAHMKLIRKPKAPRYHLDMPKIKYPSWKHFIDAAYWNVELKD